MEATRTYDSLNTAWGGIEPSPADHGSVELIVRRPVGEEREELLSARFAAADGLQGDNWLERGRAKGSDPSPDTQITLMNSRVIQLLAGDKSGWAASGDQLFVDLNITMENLPAGYAAANRRGDHANLPDTAYRMREVCPPFWRARAQMDHERYRQARAPPRRLCACRSRWGHQSRRQHQEVVDLQRNSASL